MSIRNRHSPVSVRRSPSRGVVNYIYLYGKRTWFVLRAPPVCVAYIYRYFEKLSQFAYQMRVFCHLSSNLISTIYSGRVNCSEPLMRAVIAAVGARVSSSQNNGATMLPCSKHESALLFCNPIHDGRACMVLFLSS